jgi:hypothetical protein
MRDEMQNRKVDGLASYQSSVSGLRTSIKANEDE